MYLRKYMALKISSSILLMNVLLMTTLFISGAAQAADCRFTPCVLTSDMAFTVVRSVLTSSVSNMVVNGGRPIVLTGHDQTIGFNFVTSITDARGSGAGWRVTASSPGLNLKVSRFGGLVTVNEPLWLATAGRSPVVVSCQHGSTCSPISGLVRPQVTGSLATPMVLEIAPAGQGLGAFDITTNGQFSLPGNTAPGNSYSAVITVVVSNTP